MQVICCIFLVVFLLSCQTYRSNEDYSHHKIVKINEWIWISEDPILREVLQESLHNELYIQSNYFQKIASIEVLSIESYIQDEKSLLYSLATLTMGTFRKIYSEFLFSVKYLDGIQIDEKRFTCVVKYDLVAPMPPLFGLGTTLTLGLLDRYKVPEHLRKYCIDQEPSYTQKMIESDREGYCQEYKKYLKIAWRSIELKIDKDLGGNSYR